MLTPKPVVPLTRCRLNRRGLRSAISALAVCTLQPVTEARARSVDSDESALRRQSLGSSMFVLANLFFSEEESPVFYQLNYKYMITPVDGLSVEAMTWKYSSPLGIPYGSSYDDPALRYPGAVQAYGLGVAYQRFIWEGAYAAAHVSAMRQIYLDEDKQKIQAGFQLFMTFRLGYHFEFFDDRIFVEPSVAITTWPINTNLPEAFAEQEDKWPSYFLAEPGLHFGVSF